MKIVEVVVSKSRKYNLGNYESKDYFISLKADVEITENLDEIAQQLWKQCSLLIAKAYREDSDG